MADDDIRRSSLDEIRRMRAQPATAKVEPDLTRSVESRDMIYRVVTYDKGTERMRDNLPIPPRLLKKVKDIAGFAPQDDGLGEYPLDGDQIRRVAVLLGFDPKPHRFYYAIEPYQPVEDDGLQ